MKKFFLLIFLALPVSPSLATDVESESLSIEKINSEYYRCQPDAIRHIRNQFSQAVVGVPQGIKVTSFQGITPGRIFYSVPAQNETIVEVGDGDQKLIVDTYSVVVSRAHCGLVELSYTTRLAE